MAQRAPFDGGTEVEIRQVYEASDFPATSFLPKTPRASRRCATSSKESCKAESCVPPVLK